LFQKLLNIKFCYILLPTKHIEQSKKTWNWRCNI